MTFLCNNLALKLETAVQRNPSHLYLTMFISGTIWPRSSLIRFTTTVPSVSLEQMNITPTISFLTSNTETTKVVPLHHSEKRKSYICWKGRSARSNKSVREKVASRRADVNGVKTKVTKLTGKQIGNTGDLWSMIFMIFMIFMDQCKFIMWMYIKASLIEHMKVIIYEMKNDSGQLNQSIFMVPSCPSYTALYNSKPTINWVKFLSHK